MKKYKISEMETLKEFLNSKTYRMCTDINKSMWDIGAEDIFDMWIVEKNAGSPTNIGFLKSENLYE